MFHTCTSMTWTCYITSTRTNRFNKTANLHALFFFFIFFLSVWFLDAFKRLLNCITQEGSGLSQNPGPFSLTSELWQGVKSLSLMTGVAFCSITSDARYDCEGRDRSLGNRLSQKYCFLYCNHEKASAKSTVVFFSLCFLFICFWKTKIHSVFSLFFSDKAKFRGISSECNKN